MDEDVQEIVLDEQQLKEMFGHSGDNESPSKEMTFFYEPIDLEDDEMDTITTSAEFVEGQSVGALYSWIYTTLINSGFDVESAITVVKNEQALKYNKELAKINQITSIEVAKQRAMQIDDTRM
jgi:hypothetical protein